MRSHQELFEAVIEVIFMMWEKDPQFLLGLSPELRQELIERVAKMCIAGFCGEEETPSELLH